MAKPTTQHEVNDECQEIFAEIRKSLSVLLKTAKETQKDIRQIKNDIAVIAKTDLAPEVQKELQTTGGRVHDGVRMAAKSQGRQAGSCR